MASTAFLALLPAIALGALPAESVVPGEAQVAVELPSESALPSYAESLQSGGALNEEPVAGGEEAAVEAAAESAAVHVDPAPLVAQAPPADTPAQNLPSEQTVPDSQPPALNGEAAAYNGLPLKGSPDGIPWLRFNLHGHTAPLHAITFFGPGRICTAGEDKTLVAWSALANPNGGPAKWGYDRTVRWQVQRGTRGRIYALAASPKAIAMAGEGAMGGSGEIVLIDPQSGELAGTLNDLKRGHLQVVVALSLAAPASGEALASLSMDGVLVHWQPTPDGLWKATRLSGPDSESPGIAAEFARRLQAGRTVSAVAAVNASTVVAPMYSRLQNDRVVWRLEQYNAATGEHRPLGDERQSPHWDTVTAIAVSSDGSRLASADGGGYVYLWDLRTSPATAKVLTRTQAWSLAFDAKGTRLAIGGDVAAGGRRANVEVWNVANVAAPAQLARIESDGLVAACGLSPDGQTVAWTSGARAFVRPVAGGVAQELPAGVSPPLKVAFPAEQPFHQLGIGKSTAAGRGAAITHVFDTELLRLDQVNKPDAAKWLPEGWLSGGWTVREEGTIAGRRTIELFQGGARRSRVPLTEERHGRLTASCWIPSRKSGSAPAAAAVGTSGGGIYLVTPAAEGTAPIVRQFRGHSAAITSLAISRDLKYLASASLDGAVCVWPLTDLTGDAPLVQRWGAKFDVRDGVLVVDSIRTDGPVYFRGMRQGDHLGELRYIDNTGAVRVVREPGEMLAALEQVPWETLMTFNYARGRNAASEFQIYPAWQQLVSLFVADDGEWAYWSPAGYFDASFEGHKLFGWQINRGLEMLPDFFLAAQFRQQLERPGVMSQLLRRGTLEEAFHAAAVEPPANAEDAIVNSYRLKPDVEILSPRDGAAVNGETKLTAQISVDVAERLAPPKAFANGVVAVNRRLVSETVTDGRRVSTYEWTARLPSDSRVMLQVAAATEHEITGDASVVVVNEAPKPTSAPRLFLMSVGVDSYGDAQIPKLSTAVQSTEDLLSLLQERTPPLYRMSAVSLLQDRATKASWRWLTEDLSGKLARDATPDDLVVVFLAGHGFQAPGEAGYQFVTADARYADVMAGRYSDCLSISDLAFLSKIPCRKLVILNTCHGGTMQPLQHRELKSAVRALQGDLVLTLAASGGEEEAVEGRFSKRLLEALNGAADSDADGVVSFSETVAFVERTVAADSNGESVQQTPAAGPKELLPYVAIPLSKVAPTRVSAENAREFPTVR